MKFNTLLLNVQGNVAIITLNRPDVANAINLELAMELMRAVMQCDEDSSIRAVLIRGAGPIFCGGGDVKGFADRGEDLPQHLKEITTYLHMAMSYLVRMDPPVVAAVNGSAAGAGFSLVCGCDVVLASESAKFTLAYTALGLTPDGGVTYMLPRIVGYKRALEMALTNRILSAREAFEWGIVNHVLSDSDLMSEAQNLANRLAKGPTRAFGETKRLFQSGLIDSFEGQLKNESRCISEMARSIDGREGISAFAEKRRAKFVGNHRPRP